MARTVRPPTEDDTWAIQRVARRSWHAAHDPVIGEDAVDGFVDDHYDEESIRQNVTDPDGLFYVVEDETREVVGFIAVAPDDDDVFVIGGLYVHPDYWGQGFGTSLLERAESSVVERGGEKLHLVVMAENEVAVRFYESRGFDKIDEQYDEAIDTMTSVYAKDL